jgi:hypothetical protein
MRFSQYVNDNLDWKEYCHSLAIAAQARVTRLVEMAMGTQEINDPKQMIFHDADDYKFLSQFPYQVGTNAIWTAALNWRYNQGLREMMRKSKSLTHIPQGKDWTNHLVIPLGNGKHFILGSPNNPEQTDPNHQQNIFIGLTRLAHKLTKPAKGDPDSFTSDPEHPEEPTKPHPHWAGRGPSLQEIDPKQTDPNHHQHTKNYRHGLYNFDLSDMAEVTDEDIDEIPDVEIQQWLDYPLTEYPVNAPQVQEAIKKERAKMRKVKKHTFSGYDVPQKEVTATNISDWITANSMPTTTGKPGVGLFGEHPTEYRDTLNVDEKTGHPQNYKVHYLNPQEAGKAEEAYLVHATAPKSGWEFSADYFPHKVYDKEEARGLAKKARDKGATKVKVEKIQSGTNVGHFLSKADTETGEQSRKHSIPVITKHMQFSIIDEKHQDKEGNAKKTNYDQDYTIPVLNPQKAIPQLPGQPKRVSKKGGQEAEAVEPTPEELEQEREELALSKEDFSALRLSDVQQAEFARRTKRKSGGVFDWNPAVERKEQAKKRFGTDGAAFINATRPGTLQRFLNNWDILTPQQQEWIEKNMKTAHDVAKYVHSGDKSDKLAKPQNLYGAAPRPNYKSVAQGNLQVPPSKMEDFLKKYKGKVYSELMGDWTPDTGQGYQSNSPMERYLRGMAATGKIPAQVVMALRDNLDKLAEFATYNILTFLNDKRFAFGQDEEFNLLNNVRDPDINEDENRERRLEKGKVFLWNAGAIGMKDSISRRNREKHGVHTVGDIDAPTKSGKSGAGEVAEGSQKDRIQHINLHATRRWLNSDHGTEEEKEDVSPFARAGHKVHTGIVQTSKAPEFFRMRRNQILAKLGGSPTAAAALNSAQKKLTDGMEIAIEVYNKYDTDLASSIPDAKKREAAVLQHVHDALKQGGTYTDREVEDIAQRARTLATADKPSEYDNYIRREMDAFMDKFIKTDEPMSVPHYNPMSNEIEETPTKLSPAILHPDPRMAAIFIKGLYVYNNLTREALKKWGYQLYDAIVNSHNIDKREEKVREEWETEEQKQLAGLAGPGTTQAQEKPSTPGPQRLSPQQQQAQSQADAARLMAEPLPTLLSMANSISNLDDMVRLGSALLGKRKDLMAMPGSAHVLQTALTTLRQRRMKFMHEPSTSEETELFLRQLPALVKELGQAHQ